MAGSAQGTPAGRAYVEVGTWSQPFETGLNAIERRLKRFGAFVTRIGQAMFGGGVALALPFVYALKAAGDAQESMARFGQVFGELSAEAGRFGDALADATQRGKVGTKDAMSNFQSFFVGLGWGKKQAMAMSQQMVTLGIDFASFVNIDDADALHRFISALSGSVQVLDQFGLDLHEATIAQELLRMGLKVTTATATEQQKVMARMNIIKRGMGQQGAIGQAIREAGSFMGQWRRLKSAIEDASVAIGNALLPTMITVVAWFGNVAQGMITWINANPGLVTALAATSVALIGAGIAAIGLGFALGTLGTIVGAIGVVLKLLFVTIGVMVSPIGLVVAGFVALGAAVLYFSGAGSTALSGMSALFGQLWNAATQSLQGIANALKQGEIGLALSILMAGWDVVWRTGWEAMKAVAVAGMAYVDAAVDQVGTGIYVGWVAVTTNIEGAFDTLATNLKMIWNTVLTYMAGGMDTFVTATKAALAEVWFQWREAKIAANPLMSKLAKQQSYEQVNAERQALTDAPAERAIKRQADLDASTDLPGLDRRRQERQDRIDNAGAGDEAADRARQRQNRIDQASAPSAELDAAHEALQWLTEVASFQPEILPPDKKALAIGAIAGADGAAAKVEAKNPEAAAFGSKDAASTIVRSSALDKSHLEAQQLAAMNQIKAGIDKAVTTLKDILKATGIEIKELTV